MANHVDNYIRTNTLNAEGQKVWNGITAKLNKIAEDPEGRGEVHLGLMFWDDFDAEGFDRSGMCDKVGAKWAYATDWNEATDEYQDNFINGYSAWSPVSEFASWIAKQIGEVDPDVQVSLEYRDEMPNFVGLAYFIEDGSENESYELEWEEIRELCMEQNEELAAMWDEEEMEWKEDKEEEAWDILREMEYDVVDQWMDNFR